MKRFVTIISAILLLGATLWVGSPFVEAAYAKPHAKHHKAHKAPRHKHHRTGAGA